MIIVDCKSIYNLGLLGTVLLPRCCRVLSIAQHRSYTTLWYGRLEAKPAIKNPCYYKTTCENVLGPATELNWLESYVFLYASAFIELANYHLELWIMA